MTKILQITDTHIVPEGQLAYEQVDTSTALAKTVATINRIVDQLGPIDLVLVTGDLTEHGNAEEYELFRQVMAPLKIPYHAVPGNHDKRNAMRTAFSDTDWMPRAGDLNWHLDLEQFSVLGLDSLVEDKAYGALTDETISFVSTHLDRLNGQPVLIGFHHPPFEVGIAPMDAQNLRETEAFSQAISGYHGEIRLACGHLHRSIVGSFAGHICQVCPGTSHAVTLDQRKNADNSLTKEPGAFMLHEWREDRFLSHWLPVGDFEGPYPFLGVS